MPKFIFSKLVRDDIINQQIASGAKPEYRQLSNDERELELIEKVIEEVKELSNADTNELAQEIGDVQQALDDLKLLYGLDDTTVREAQQKKNEQYGTFSKGLFVEHVELDEDHEWVAHFRENADRYPEID